MAAKNRSALGFPSGHASLEFSTKRINAQTGYLSGIAE